MNIKLKYEIKIKSRMKKHREKKNYSRICWGL